MAIEQLNAYINENVRAHNYGQMKDETLQENYKEAQTLEKLLNITLAKLKDNMYEMESQLVERGLETTYGQKVAVISEEITDISAALKDGLVRAAVQRLATFDIGYLVSKVMRDADDVEEVIGRYNDLHDDIAAEVGNAKSRAHSLGDASLLDALEGVVVPDSISDARLEELIKSTTMESIYKTGAHKGGKRYKVNTVKKATEDINRTAKAVGEKFGVKFE